MFFTPPNVHTYRPGEMDEFHDFVAVRHLAVLSATGNPEKDLAGQGILVGPPLGETKVHGMTYFSVSDTPQEGEGKVVWFSSESPPSLRAKTFLTHASIERTGGRHLIVHKKAKERVHLFYILTGIPRPFHFTREIALTHFLEWGGRPMPHGSVAIEQDVTVIESFKDKMPERIYVHQDVEIIDGVVVPFERHEIWLVPEGCSLLTANISHLTRQPLTRWVRVERGKVVIRHGRLGDYDRFLAASGVLAPRGRVA